VHPAAVASQFLVAFGNAVGRSPYFDILETRHGVQEFCLIVGPTSTGRKGDARHVALAPLAVDAAWRKKCVRAGLSSGEGLIYHVRDEVRAIERKTGEQVVVDAGVTDKRMLVVETEFSRPLKMFEREGNVLSDTLRHCWDGDQVLSTLTKNVPITATEPHVSVIGHTTREDLRRYLSDVDVANGFGNRFFFVAVDRPCLVPSPHALAETTRTVLMEQTGAALRHGQTVGRLGRTAAAEGLWCEVYPDLSAERPGLIGALLARGPAHVLRLAALFALLAQKTAVDVPHLMAALAWWDYVVASVGIVFADRTGNAEADRIKVEMLPGQRLSLTDIRKEIFANHVSAGRLRDGLDLLERLGAVAVRPEETDGRSRLMVERLNSAAPGGGSAL
jgi:hypothetical protein